MSKMKELKQEGRIEILERLQLREENRVCLPNLIYRDIDRGMCSKSVLARVSLPSHAKIRTVKTRCSLFTTSGTTVEPGGPKLFPLP